jgi:hypothetical protein
MSGDISMGSSDEARKSFFCGDFVGDCSIYYQEYFKKLEYLIVLKK